MAYAGIQSLQHMRTANLEADGLVRDAFVCTSDAFCLLQDLLPHLLKVIEAFAYSTKGTCPSLSVKDKVLTSIS